RGRRSRGLRLRPGAGRIAVFRLVPVRRVRIRLVGLPADEADEAVRDPALPLVAVLRTLELLRAPPVVRGVALARPPGLRLRQPEGGHDRDEGEEDADQPEELLALEHRDGD